MISQHSTSFEKRKESRARKFSKQKSGQAMLVAPNLATKSSSVIGDALLKKQPSVLEDFTNQLASACLSSAPILGERIDKGVLKRRIDRLEDALGNFALLSDLNEEVDAMNNQLNIKVDKKDFKELRKKKANLSDLQTFRDQVFEQMETLRAMVDNIAVNGASSGPSAGKEISTDIARRFDMLYNQFQDLVAHCAGFVHRFVMILKLLKSMITFHL
jgi:hypothetical protein